MRSVFKTLLLAGMLLAFITQGVYADPVVTLRSTEGSLSQAMLISGFADAITARSAIPWSGTQSGWDFVTNMGYGSAVVGAATISLTFDITSTEGTAGSLEMTFTRANPTPAFPGWSFYSGGAVSGGIEKVVYTVYQSDTSGAFTVGGNLIGTMTFLGNPFGDSIAGRLETDQLYSLTRIATVWSAGEGQLPGITSLTHMPEPTSLLLLGTGLAGLALWRIRKSK